MIGRAIAPLLGVPDAPTPTELEAGWKSRASDRLGLLEIFGMGEPGAAVELGLGTHIKTHRIAALPAIEVTKQRIEDLRDEALATKEGKRPPAAATIKFALAILSRVYNWVARPVSGPSGGL